MENWNPSIVYDMAIERHTEVIARGEASQRQPSLPGSQTARARIAAALVALAARLDAVTTDRRVAGSGA